MKALILTTLITGLLFTASAQQNKRSIISTLGASYTNGAVKVKVSAGEPIVGKSSNQSLVLSQGFFTGSAQAPNAVNNITEENAYAFYPNPATDKLLISGDLQKISKVELTNMIGQSVLSAMPFNGAINLSILPSGVYIARVYNTENTLTYSTKIIKQ